MFETSDPAELWLNITNLALAAVVITCVVIVGGALLREALERLMKPAAGRRPADDHAFNVPELGLTMADGGERERPQPKKLRAR